MIPTEQIMRFLPHRFPFLLVDRIVDLVPSQTIVAIKNVTCNEQFFQGHFPEWKIMPGVLIVEAMAQAGAAHAADPFVAPLFCASSSLFPSRWQKNRGCP